MMLIMSALTGTLRCGTMVSGGTHHRDDPCFSPGWHALPEKELC